MNKFFQVIQSSKILLPVFVVSLFLGLFLFFYIPSIAEKAMIKHIVKHSKESVERLQIQREYYTKVVVADVKKYAPELSFSYEHQGVDARLPFPTTTIHNLTELYSQRGDIKFALYSQYPFLNRKDRVLSPFQKKAIEKIKEANDGVFIQKDIIDGKEVVRVAIADYMVIDACVQCHNNHKLKDWDFDWKIGDVRGVIEVITPIDTAVENMLIARNKTVAISLAFMILLVIYYAFILLRRENELHHENELLNEDLADIFDGFDTNVIASKTDLKGCITYASRKFIEVSGYSQEELLGKNHNIVKHTQEGNEIFLKMWSDITNDKTWRGEIKNRKKDGSYYWVYAVISPLYNKDGKKIGYSAIREDIPDKKKVIELNATLQQKISLEVDKNRQKDQQLMQQSRLAQMGEMISMIAHQWRQPLMAISATSASINLKTRLGKLNDEISLEYSSEITQHCQYLSVTIDDFRDFFKPNKELQLVNYTEVVESVLEISKYSITNNKIKIIKELHSDKIFNTYANEIKQVLLNLIKNAQDVLLDRDIKSPRITIKTYKNELSISDNGGGIQEDILDKIFDPYFSTKKEKDGTGLGLYMSKLIIQEHCNGILKVTNTQDGVEFKIVLNAE